MFINLARETLTPEELASLCGGTIARDGKNGLRVCSVCTDSREVKPGTAFLAIRGARVDGHRFIRTAAEAGAAAVIAEYLPEDMRDVQIPVILTDSSVAAIGRFAAQYTSKSSVFRVAVTGSVGKTTTKEMISAVLAERNCFRSAGNFNSILGMPMSLLSMPESAGCAVFEMGLEERGEISAMSRICRPSVAVVTNVGSSHLEHIGSIEQLIREKMSVCEGLAPGGVLLTDYLLAREADAVLGEPVGCRRLTFSYSGEEGADYRAENVRENGTSQTFDVLCPDRAVRGITVGVYGWHNLQAALIAVAVGDLFGLPEEEIRAGLGAYRPVAMRQELIRRGGITVINDCYNASPESMRAACDVLCGKSFGTGRRFAVLGDMLELGSGSERMHYETGRYFASHGLDVLLTFGNASLAVAKGAQTLMPSAAVYTFPDVNRPEEPAQRLSELMRPGDTVLIKASRGIAAERITEALLALAEPTSKE